MLPFDVAFALSQDQLDYTSNDLYRIFSPEYFSGTKEVNKDGVISLQWSIGYPPLFNLSPNSRQNASKAIAESLLEQRDASAQHMTLEDMREFVGSTMVVFEIDLSSVNLIFMQQTENSSPAERFFQLINVKVNCSIQVKDGVAYFQPHTVTCDPLPSPVDQFFLKAVVLPDIQKKLQSFGEAFTLPQPVFAGKAMSTPAISIVENYLVIAANLAENGPPPPVQGLYWQPQYPGLFMMMINPGLIMRTLGVEKTFSDSGSGGNPFAGYEWNGTGAIYIEEPENWGRIINIRAMVFGNASATLYAMNIPVSVEFVAEPTPVYAELAIVPQNGVVDVVAQSVTPFTVDVEPADNIPSQVAGWVVDGIVQGLVNSLVGHAQQYLTGLNIASIDIPTVSTKIASKPVTMTVANIGVLRDPICLHLCGTLEVRQEH